jgi:hypothetical protein
VDFDDVFDKAALPIWSPTEPICTRRLHVENGAVARPRDAPWVYGD